MLYVVTRAYYGGEAAMVIGVFDSIEGARNGALAYEQSYENAMWHEPGEDTNVELDWQPSMYPEWVIETAKRAIHEYDIRSFELNKPKTYD